MKQVVLSSALSIVAFMALIQPAPAPFATGLAVGVIGGTILGGGIAGGTAAVIANSHGRGLQEIVIPHNNAGGGGGGGPTVQPTHIDKREDELDALNSTLEAPGTSEKVIAAYNDCYSKSIHSRQIITYYDKSKDVVISGLPESCVVAITAYNTNPDIGDLNAVHGKYTPINSTAVLLSDLPAYQLSTLEYAAKKPAAQRLRSRFARALSY